MGDTYLHKLNRARGEFGTVFINHAAEAKHGNLTQNWMFSNLGGHCQALRSFGNKLLKLNISIASVSNFHPSTYFYKLETLQVSNHQMQR